MKDKSGTEIPLPRRNQFVTAIGAGTTYPDYKPAPFIVSSKVDDIDMITVVTEGIFSYCGAKVKIDTDRHIGPERSLVRAEGEPIGHVTTGEYGSQMLSLGGVHHLTGGTKKEGRITCASLLSLCNGDALEISIDHGSELTIQAGKAPIINGVEEERIGALVADLPLWVCSPHNGKALLTKSSLLMIHITGVMSEHQAGKVIGWAQTGIKIKGRRSTPGRYFQVAEPGTGWGATNLHDPISILGDFNPNIAKPGQTLLMVSTTGEHFAYFELDQNLVPVEHEIPARLRPSIERIEENCEPALCSVLFIGGAGGSLRAGATENAGATDPLCPASTHQCYLWRRANLSLARRWNNDHGRCRAHAAKLVRLCSNACTCRTYRVYGQARRL